jgi:hypothetical protein
MVQDILWNPNSHSACQTTACILYGIRRFINVLKKARHWTLSWGSRLQFAPSIPTSLRYIKEPVQVRGALKHFVTSYIFYGEGLLAPRPNPSWRSTHCRLSATAYSIHSQLTSVSGGLPSIRNLRTRHDVATGTHITYKLQKQNKKKTKFPVCSHDRVWVSEDI